ncbi:hypothetical protein niasHT_026715 [Heterodera trifolii]|uniref:Uncharacterized protein n=1 Tax=Heterodera trifolii TaxID=157864 RepID=A0ABD2JNH6_9BILA
MNFALLWVVLLLFHLKIDQAHSDDHDNNFECRGVATDQMKPFQYKSDRWEEKMEIKIAETNLHQGKEQLVPDFDGTAYNGYIEQPYKIEVTPKMDIWSAGIVIFMTATNIQLVSELYRSPALNLEAEITADLLIEMHLTIASARPGAKEWWERYFVVIMQILFTWYQMPDIAFLLGNMLNIQPEMRMSAAGVVDYLEGKCKPTDYEKNHDKLALFGNVSREKLRQMIQTDGFDLFDEEFAKANGGLRTARKDLEWYLAYAEKSVLDFLQELDVRVELCDQ